MNVIIYKNHFKITYIFMQCAKIELPPQTIILSTTSSKYHFLGAIFPGVSMILISFHIII